jgi:hypothetical protein
VEASAVSYRRRLIVPESIALLLAISISGTARGAFQVVEVSPDPAAPGTIVSFHAAMSGRIAGTEPAPLLMIPEGTWGDSPDDLRCEEVGGAVEVGETTWRPGTVEWQGVAYDGVLGQSVFVLPALTPGNYRLAETIETRGTRCHVFTTLQVVAELPDTAVRPGAAIRDLRILSIVLFAALGYSVTRRLMGRT